MDILIAKPQVEVDEAVKALVKEQTESCTILHCRFLSEDTAIRIWLSTFLFEEDGKRKQLIKAFNISLMPQWTLAKPVNNYIHFTLLFEGLSKTCSNFYMLEDIPEPSGFYSESISRNKTDVYQVEVYSK